MRQGCNQPTRPAVAVAQRFFQRLGFGKQASDARWALLLRGYGWLTRFRTIAIRVAISVV